MDYRPLLPAPLLRAAHIAPFDALIRNFIGSDSDLTGDEALWYYATVLDFDTVPAAMLPYLAVMFGVDGYKGFDYATTEDLKRTTLKNAVLMKRRHGTAWAIKTALENAGFLYVNIIEHCSPQILFDGVYLFDGSQQFDSLHWAHFIVEMEPPVGVQPEDVDVEKLMILINYWKRKCTLCIRVAINQIVITDFGVGFDMPYIFDGELVFDGTQVFG